MNGDTPVFPWLHLDAETVPCEVRLVRLPHASRKLIRGSITDMSERARVEQRQSLMMRELDHRVKNNLATMLALAQQTAAHAGSIAEFRESFEHRVRAMARTHQALAASRWEGVALGDVVRLTLEPYARQGDRVRVDGAVFTLAASTSAAMSMALNELATNAAKYGALSRAEGRVDVRWSLRGDELELDWTESGGPPVTAPDRTGFGTMLLRGVITHELRGRVELDYAAEGVRCRIRLPVAGNRYQGLAASQSSNRPLSQ